MKEKVEEIIFLRGLAIIGIVLLHVTAYFLTPANSDFLVYKISLVLNQAVRFTLPLFLVISGFGLAYGFQQGTSINIKGYLSRRLDSVLLPYIFWSLIFFLFYIFFLNKIPNGIKVTDLQPHSFNLSLLKVYFMNLVFGWNYVHLYFVVLILQFYLIFPLIITRLAQVKNRRLLIGFSFVIYLLLMIYLFYFRKLTGYPSVDIFVRYYWQMFISWYFYFLFGLMMGLWFQDFKIILRQHLGKATLLYLFTSFLVIGEGLLTEPAHIGKLTSLRPTVLFNTVSAVFFYFGVAQLLERRFSIITKILKSFGNKSFGIYFVHLLILFLAQGFLIKSWPHLFSFQRTLFMPVLFAVTLAGSVVFVVIADRLPFRKIITGKN